jgi:phytoene dehydrogenase-like protein
MTDTIEHYDCAVIGAGMSGIACAIRLGHFGKKVILIEKHSVLGGLNSYFQRVKFDGDGKRIGLRKFDVGLHALTNYAVKGERNRPLLKICKQLRIPYDQLKLRAQSFSAVKTPYGQLEFSNNIEDLLNQIEAKFPQHKLSFLELIDNVEKFNDGNLEWQYQSSFSVLNEIFRDEYFARLILFPLLCYGSSWEEDMDYLQFVILFKAVYLEGFSRPLGGVRTILNILNTKLEENGVDLFFKKNVTKIDGEKIYINGEHKVNATQIYSSIGLPETFDLDASISMSKAPIGKFSFVEVILVFAKKVEHFQKTILFFSRFKEAFYRCPTTSTSFDSSIVCVPDNYSENEYDEGHVRLTFMANYDLWENFSPEQYQAKKAACLLEAKKMWQEICPEDDREIIYSDVFTPLTIKKFTGHLKGTVYGSPEKNRTGQTDKENLFVIGTDQGYLGVVGSLLSGISMANKHGFSG